MGDELVKKLNNGDLHTHDWVKHPTATQGNWKQIWHSDFLKKLLKKYDQTMNDAANAKCKKRRQHGLLGVRKEKDLKRRFAAAAAATVGAKAASRKKTKRVNKSKA